MSARATGIRMWTGLLTRYGLRRREPRLSTPARLDADGVARLQLDASRRDGDVVQLEDRGEGLHRVDGESDKQ